MVLPASSLHMEKRCKGMQRRGTQCQQQQPPPQLSPPSITCSGSSPTFCPHLPSLGSALTAQKLGDQQLQHLCHNAIE